MRFSHNPNGARTINKTGACFVIALASAVGVKYEHATAWTIKKDFAWKLVDTNVLEGHEVRGVYAGKVAVHVRRGGKIMGRDAKLHLPAMGGVIAEGVTTFEPCTLGRFAKNNPRGKFIVSIKGHAVAVVHGRIINNNELDSTYNLRARVKQAIQILPA